MYELELQIYAEYNQGNIDYEEFLNRLEKLKELI